MANPFDLNRDGRWSVPERALTHYGVDPLLRKGGGGGRSGCGCLSVFAVALVVLLVLLFVSAG